MTVAPPTSPPMPQPPEDQEHWIPKPLGWRLIFSDRLLWIAVGLSFVAHLILLAPQYGIKVPQRGDKSLWVSFKTLSQPMVRKPPASRVEPQTAAKNGSKQDARSRVTRPDRATNTPKPPPVDAQPQSNSALNGAANGGRRVTLTPGMKDYRYSQYLEDWRRKVERIGAMNYPEEARGKFFGSLVMSVALRPDGSIDRIVIVRSSGNKVLDDSAKRIVMMAAPFAPFPPDIRKETDYLDITRTWNFTRGDALETR
ncbi:MAG: energy transducer TonB [Rhodocyclaceae bacterium]|jgi:TonB family protein|nr:energy transducer TonB [Rhodocyclaceae bacterium]